MRPSGPQGQKHDAKQKENLKVVIESPHRGQNYDHSWSASTPLVYKNGSVVPVIGITPKSIKMLWELS